MGQRITGAGFVDADVGGTVSIHDVHPKFWWRPVLRLRALVPLAVRLRYPRPLVRAVRTLEKRFCFEDGPNAGNYEITEVVSGTEVEVRCERRGK
jgi:hypothetical protein